MIRFSSSKEEQFWRWFSKNSKKILHFDKDQNNLFHNLKLRLDKIDPNLVFEFSPILKDGTREFIISADGVKSSFTSVINLVKSAPYLTDWKITAFRQPHFEITQISYETLTVRFDDVFFRYVCAEGKMSLDLFIRNFYESAEWTSLSFILLDTILGEYKTEMYLGSINKHILKNSVMYDDLIPISELPKILDSCILLWNN